MRISETRGAVVGYELKFADAAQGLVRRPLRQALAQGGVVFPGQWLFVISKDTAGEKRIAPAGT